MSLETPGTTDGTETHERGEDDRLARPKRVLSAVGRRGGDGVAISLLGGAALGTAARTAGRNRRRAGLLAATGVALLGVGLDRRARDGTVRSTGGERQRSAEASAHDTASDLVGVSETNPRGVSEESDVDVHPDEGSIQFTTGQEETGERKPHLDGADPVDPRYADSDDPLPDDHVEVSLSETKTTDELGKVAAPDEEQAYPASEGTDPEPMSEKAPPRYGEGAVADADVDGDVSGPDDEDGATEDDSRADDGTT